MLKIKKKIFSVDYMGEGAVSICVVCVYTRERKTV